MERPALLILDMLNDFILPEGALYIGEKAPQLLTPIKKEIEKAQRENTPIIYICDHHHPHDYEFTMFPAHCTIGSKGGEIVEDLSPPEGSIIINKRRYSGFFATDLDITLRELGVDTLMITGVCTNICVLYTAVDARSLGYSVVVVRDGVASFDERAHQWALQEMENTLKVQFI